MAAQPYQEMGFDIGRFESGGRVAPLEAQAAAQTAAAAAAPSQALAGLGNALLPFAQRYEDAQQKSRVLEAQTQALVGFDALNKKYERDTDYTTLRDRFSADADKLTGQILTDSRLDPDHTAFLTKNLTELKLHSSGALDKRAFSGEQAKNIANLNQSDIAFQTRYLAAQSDAERASVLKQQSDGWSLAVASGWTNAEQGQRAVETFRKQAEDGELLRLINTRPRDAVGALADPNRYRYLDPSLRSARAAQAANVLDTQGQLEIGNLALRSPSSAALAVGKASDPATAAAIFNHGLIPQESGWRGDAVSPAGALGVSQLIPDTARAAARRLGLADVAALPDDALKQRLLTDKWLNHRLGLNEFQRLLTRFDGDVPAALAGYNAGEGNADKPRAAAWRAEAMSKFGPNYTPEQFASVIPIRETHDYVLKIYERLGARTDAHGLSETARLRAQTHIASEVAQENAQTRQLYARMAADAVTQDPIADALKGGAWVDPGRVSAQRQLLTQAATAGDAHAEKELRQLDYAEEAAPVMAQAYRMAPAQLSAAVASEEARIANSGASPADLRRFEVLKTVLADVQTRAAADPVGLAARAGAFVATPLPVETPASPEFARALASRNFQASAAAELYGGALVPLRPQEALALKNWWGQATPADRVSLAAQFAGNLDGDAARAAVKQIAGDDVLARTAGQIALRAPATAQKIMQGASLLESGTVKPKIGDVRAALAETVKGQIYLSPRTQNEAVEAGLAVYAANRAASGALFDAADRPGIEAAIEEVTGKIVEVNGARAPLPPGVAPAAARQALAGLTENDLAPFGGLQQGLDAAYVGGHAQLHALELGGGAYALTIGDRPVMDASGARPLVVDLARLAAKRSRLAFATPEEATAAINDRAGVGRPALPRSAQEAAVTETMGLRPFDNPPGAP